MDIVRGLKELFAAGVDLIYPRVCCVCHRSLTRGEKVICLHCLDALPRTDVHRSEFNFIHKKLAGHTLIERAGAWFHYSRESNYASIIHDAKYRGMPDLAREAARLYAGEIIGDGFFDDIDIILPVPMHTAKMLSRGYNQAEMAARGISEATGIPVADNLVATRGHDSQTRKNSWERLLNARNIYELIRAAEIEGRHILIVDDVITTGATMLACADAVRQGAPSARISVLALAATSLH